jgi:hypothetical protein
MEVTYKNQSSTPPPPIFSLVFLNPVFEGLKKKPINPPTCAESIQKALTHLVFFLFFFEPFFYCIFRRFSASGVRFKNTKHQNICFCKVEKVNTYNLQTN